MSELAPNSSFSAYLLPHKIYTIYKQQTVPKTNCIKPHRATIPKHNIEFKPTTSNNEKLIGFALDMEKGIFTQRRKIKVNNENNLNCQIDDIYYAHATLPNALIHQVSFTNMDKEHDIDISNIIENQFEFNIGKDGGDFNWDINGTSNISNNIYNMHGTVKNMELPDEKFTSIATATSEPNNSLPRASVATLFSSKTSNNLLGLCLGRGIACGGGGGGTETSFNNR